MSPTSYQLLYPAIERGTVRRRFRSVNKTRSRIGALWLCPAHVGRVDTQAGLPLQCRAPVCVAAGVARSHGASGIRFAPSFLVNETPMVGRRSRVWRLRPPSGSTDAHPVNHDKRRLPGRRVLASGPGIPGCVMAALQVLVLAVLVRIQAG